MAAGAALVLVVAGVGCAVVAAAVADAGSTSVVSADAGDEGQAAGPGASEPEPGPSSGRVDGPPDDPGAGAVYVHILGRVASPGLYELAAGARAIDAIAAAGGFSDGADPAGVNLARLVVDGEQLVVPAAGEAPQPAPGGAPAPAGPPGVAPGGMVDLNTADAATLDTLPRIGPAIAARIIAWREANGGFSVVEDLQEVSGIGEATFAALRDLVTV
jgi:competence protein ComEA